MPFPGNSWLTCTLYSFTSWWTVVFSILYMVLYLMGIGGIFTSIASHTIWLGLTYVQPHQVVFALKLILLPF